MTTSNEKKLTQEIEKWIIKYMEEPMATRNLILREAQRHMNNLDFVDLLTILIDITQVEINKKKEV